MIEVTFLIPITQNSNGKYHSKKLWDAFHTDLCDTFGGFTKECKVYGQWKDDNGIVIEDYSWKYIVAIGKERITEMVELRNILCKYKPLFDQECIYLSCKGKVEFI